MPIQFDNTNTGTFTFNSPTTGGYALTFPSADGTNTQCFKADTSGNLTFAATTGLVVAGFTFALNCFSAFLLLPSFFFLPLSNGSICFNFDKTNIVN